MRTFKEYLDDMDDDDLDRDFDRDPDDPDFDDCDFADPGGRSALRAGKRIHPCPTCKKPNRLTDKDVALGYQCDDCADRAEGGGY